MTNKREAVEFLSSLAFYFLVMKVAYILPPSDSSMFSCLLPSVCLCSMFSCLNQKSEGSREIPPKHHDEGFEKRNEKTGDISQSRNKLQWRQHHVIPSPSSNIEITYHWKAVKFAYNRIPSFSFKKKKEENARKISRCLTFWCLIFLMAEGMQSTRWQRERKGCKMCNIQEKEMKNLQEM